MSKGYKELWDVDPALFEKAQAPVVSIYLPTNRKDNLENEGEDNKERIELKDLIERARDTLEKTCEKGRDYAVVIDNLKNLDASPEDPAWLDVSKSVAIFADSADNVYVYHLDYTVEPVVIAGDQFYVKPLLRNLQYGAHYFLLALSNDRFAFIDGSSDHLYRIELPSDVKADFAETYADYDGDDSALDYYSLEGHESPFHGWRSRNDVRQLEGEKFFRYVNKMVKEHLLRGRDWPMILVSLPEHQHEFRQISTIPTLLPEGIDKNPDQLTGSELVADAKPILAKAREAKMAKLMEEFGDAEAHGHATVHVDDVAKALFERKVRALFLERDKVIAGVYDENTGSLTDGSDEGAPVDDILAGVAHATLKQGGDVYILEPGQVPGESGVAALYRY